MSVEDKHMAREVMRELARRRNIDITDTKVSVSRAVAYVGGVIRAAPGEYIDPKVETKSLLDGCRRIPGLRDVALDVRWELGSKR